MHAEARMALALARLSHRCAAPCRRVLRFQRVLGPDIHLHVNLATPKTIVYINIKPAAKEAFLYHINPTCAHLKSGRVTPVAEGMSPEQAHNARMLLAKLAAKDFFDMEMRRDSRWNHNAFELAANTMTDLMTALASLEKNSGKQLPLMTREAMKERLGTEFTLRKAQYNKGKNGKTEMRRKVTMVNSRRSRVRSSIAQHSTACTVGARRCALTCALSRPRVRLPPLCHQVGNSYRAEFTRRSKLEEQGPYFALNGSRCVGDLLNDISDPFIASDVDEEAVDTEDADDSTAASTISAAAASSAASPSSAASVVSASSESNPKPKLFTLTTRLPHLSDDAIAAMEAIEASLQEEWTRTHPNGPPRLPRKCGSVISRRWTEGAGAAKRAAIVMKMACDAPADGFPSCAWAVDMSRLHAHMDTIMIAGTEAAWNPAGCLEPSVRTHARPERGDWHERAHAHPRC